mmetsp:Transcript_24735/g.44578  ORF Transcript_24735/g.44578 Transcript_24735/m.44578 type:complete len:217 (+) Transcript_24735:198-848(+)
MLHDINIHLINIKIKQNFLSHRCNKSDSGTNESRRSTRSAIASTRTITARSPERRLKCLSIRMPMIALLAQGEVALVRLGIVPPETSALRRRRLREKRIAHIVNRARSRHGPALAARLLTAILRTLPVHVGTHSVRIVAQSRHGIVARRPPIVLLLLPLGMAVVLVDGDAVPRRAALVRLDDRFLTRVREGRAAGLAERGGLFLETAVAIAHAGGR